VSVFKTPPDNMPIIQDPRYLELAIAGAVNSNLFTPSEAPIERPSFLDTAAAASRQATLAGAGYARLSQSDPELADVPSNFDPLEHIQGFEDDAHLFVRASSPSEVEGIKQRLNLQRADQDVLRRAGLGGAGAQLVMTMLDPTFLAAAGAPELAMAKASRAGRALNAAVQGAVGASAYEAGMHALQDNRSLQESLFNIGSGALLGGVLGSIGRRVPSEELAALRARVDAENRGPARSAARRGSTCRHDARARDARARRANAVEGAEQDSFTAYRSGSRDECAIG
jgi:hypothetical protein